MLKIIFLQLLIKKREKAAAACKKWRAKNLNYRRNYYAKNKEKELNSNRLWRLSNLEKALNISKNYYKNNKNNFKYKKQRNEYRKTRVKTDPKFKLICNLRRRLNKALKSKKWRKDNTTKNILGCNADQLKQHLEQQSQPGMTWENQGSFWHIDHIIPLSSALSKEELYKLCHYTNLQPLMALDNLKKGCKILK